MKDCPTCGNEIPDPATVCRFCNGAVPIRTIRSTPARIRDINIKADRPTVEEGLVRMESELLRARQAKVRLVRIIHGYGSSGVGGELRVACRKHLAGQLRHRKIKSFVEGERYSFFGAAARDLVQRYSDLQRSRRSDSENPGITFVEL